MPSNHTGDPTTFSPTVSFPTDGDPKHITPIRSALDVLLDNDAYLNTLGAARRLDTSVLRMREKTQGGVTISDTAESIAATKRGDATLLLAFKTAQTFAITGWDRFAELGVPGSITSLVTDAANNGTRVLIVGTGGNRCAFSDDDGQSWTNGGDIGATPTRIVWNGNKGKFLVANGANGVKFSTNGVAWTAGTTPGIEVDAGLAVLSGGNVYGVLITKDVRQSTDGGATWTTPGGVLPNPGTLDDSGSFAGNEGAVVYHCGRHSSGANLQIGSSSDATVAWTLLATITAPSGCTFSARPRVMVCQNTGLLVVAAPLTTAVGLVTLALYASTDGVTWVGPSQIFPNPGVNGVALAGGCLVSTHNAQLFASDGLGDI